MNYRLISIGACLIVMAVITACNPQINSSVATFNAEATKVARAGGSLAQTLAVTPTPSPTPVVVTYDLTADPTGLLIHAWGQAYGLPSGSAFTIVATQGQVSERVLQNLQLAGYQNTVKGGTAAIGSGQIRLDLSIVDTRGATGNATLTFQPGLETGGHLVLHPIGSTFGTLQLPDGLLGRIGDGVELALMGATSDSQSKVTLSSLSLENGVMKVAGTVK